MAEFIGVNVHTMFPHCIQLWSHFLQNLCIDRDYTEGNFVSLLIKELHNGVHRWVYVWLYYITFSFDHVWIWWVRIRSVDFSSQCSSMIMWQNTYAWISSYCVATSNSTLISFFENYISKFYQGNFCLKELRDGVCRLEYSYHVVVLHLPIIAVIWRVQLFWRVVFGYFMHHVVYIPWMHSWEHHWTNLVAVCLGGIVFMTEQSKALVADCSLCLLFDTEDGASMVLWNFIELLLDYTALHPSMWYFSFLKGIWDQGEGKENIWT
jgi:hypothetical protein